MCRDDRRGGSLANPGSTVRELLQRTRKDKQTSNTTPKKGFRCKKTEQHKERAEHNRSRCKKMEQYKERAKHNRSRCEKTEQHKERVEHNRLFMEKAEQSLLFLTAAGTVCSIGDRKWYGPCVLILAMLASGDLRVYVEEEERLPCLREKRAVSQEKYHLEAYDCSEPEEVKVYPTLLQCPETKGLVSPSTPSTTKRQNYTIL